MKNFILFFPVLFLSNISLAQSLPQLHSYEIVDTVCNDYTSKHFLNITVKDSDADSTYIASAAFDLGYIDAGDLVIESPPYIPGDTLRTFKLYGFTNTQLPLSGLVEDYLVFEMADELNDQTTTMNYDIGPVGIYGTIDVLLDLSGVTFCSTENPVDISSYGSPLGGVFRWGIDEVITTNGMLDIQHYMSEANDGVEYYYENSAGCGNSYYEYPNIMNAPTGSMSVTNSTCANADGSATVAITGGLAPYDVYWTTGFQELNVSSGASSVSNLSSGMYYANIYDANGCHYQSTANISDSDLSITPTITDPTCPNSTDGSIQLAVSGGTVSSIFWSNGQWGNQISNLAAGEYTATITTDANCKAYEMYTVNQANGLSVSEDYLGYYDCAETNPFLYSYIEITTTGGSGNYSWNWSSGQTTEDIYNLPVGAYTCTVTDNTTGCDYTWSTEITDYSGPYVSVTSVERPNCGELNGEIDILATPGGSGAQIISTEWSNGASTEDLSGIDAGMYTILVEDANGCVASQTVDLTYLKPYQPTICLLTVDMSYTYNQVVWEKDPTQNIEGFKVYRETQQLGQFEQVAQRPYSLESFFMDNAASPMDRSWRYYITTYDACGNESLPSFIHKTIHTMSNTSNGTDYDVSWDDYEGISYSGVDVYRYDDINGWNVIATGLSGNSYTDTPTETAGLDYMVSFVLNTPCTSTKATDYNSSRSNTTSDVFNPGNSTTSISTEKENQILAYPNPADNNLTLFIDQWDSFNFVSLRDAQGKEVVLQPINGNYTNISLRHLADGIYFLTLTNGETVFKEKIIKR